VAFDINREDEDGHVIESLEFDTGPLSRLLPDFRDESFHCLRFIDPYGNTTFNRFQVEHQFLPEWKRLYDRAESRDDRRLLRAVEHLARRCLEDVHLYLKFVGD